MTRMQTLLQLANDWAESRTRETTWRPGQSIDELLSARSARILFVAELQRLAQACEANDARLVRAEADIASARRFANSALDRAVAAELRAARADVRREAVERQLEAAREAGRAALDRARRAEAAMQGASR